MLFPLRAIFWPKREILIVSDLHLGKAGHFRKHGIAISTKVHLHDIQNLEVLIDWIQPKEVFFLGDLFHSYENCEWKDFLNFLHRYPDISFTLIEGNHDILADYPGRLNLVSRIELPPFSFTHIKEEDDLYNISGHLHPGVTVRGKARQGITMSCFLFSDIFAIMPAFGQFTGIKKIRPRKKDRVFAITGRQVLELP